MDSKLIQELITETTIEDIPDRYRGIVEITGIEVFAKLSEYAMGDELYFPKLESVIASARNRRIQKEYNGYNVKDLAEKYNLTTPAIGRILKGVSLPGQMDIFDWERYSGKQF